MGIATYTVAEAAIIAFVLWRVVGIVAILAMWAIEMYRARQRRRHQLFAEELAFRIRNGLYPSEGLKAFQAGGFTTDEAITAFRRLGRNPSFFNPVLGEPWPKTQSRKPGETR